MVGSSIILATTVPLAPQQESLVRRAVPVERVVAQICREAGGRVATDVFLRDLNMGLPISDARRLEVVANGLPSFHGAQVAVDVTLVSPIQRDGCPRPGADTVAGARPPKNSFVLWHVGER